MSRDFKLLPFLLDRLASYGFSADMDEAIVLEVYGNGCPGVFNFEGSVYVHNLNNTAVTYETAIQLDKSNLNTRSYGFLGYSVKFGRFCTERFTDICLAAGAPNMFSFDSINLNYSKSAISNEKGSAVSPPPAPPQEFGDCQPSPTRGRRVPMMKVLSNSKKILQQRANRSRQGHAPAMKGAHPRESGVREDDPLCVKAPNCQNGDRKGPLSSEADVGPVKYLPDQCPDLKVNCKSTQTQFSGDKKSGALNPGAPSHQLLDGRLRLPETSSFSDTQCSGQRKVTRDLTSREPVPERQHGYFHRQTTHRSFPRRPSLLKSSASWRGHVSSKRNRLSYGVEKRTVLETVHISPGHAEKQNGGTADVYEKGKKGKLEDGQTRGRSPKEKSRTKGSRPGSGERNRGSSFQRDSADQHSTPENPRSKWRKMVQNEAGRRRRNNELDRTDDSRSPVENQLKRETIRHDATSQEDVIRRRSLSRSACKSPYASCGPKRGDHRNSMRAIVTELTKSRNPAPDCSTDH
ncbi:hypothetical protein Btru_055734 [Bulinus truncatus]|nr:hypothetical protein Btru_055734 [Bulinus truncatus]